MMFISCIWLGAIYKNVSEKSFKSYFTADGKLPLSILTGTLMSTFFSGVIIVGFGGKAASSGIVMWVGSLGLIYVMRYPIFIVAQAARNKFPPGVYTLPDFCGYYYGKTAGGLAALLNLTYNMVRYATQMLAFDYRGYNITLLYYVCRCLGSSYYRFYPGSSNVYRNRAGLCIHFWKGRRI